MEKLNKKVLKNFVNHLKLRNHENVSYIQKQQNKYFYIINIYDD